MAKLRLLSIKDMENPPARPKKVLLFMAAPIVYASLLMGALGLLVLFIWIGERADGDKIRMRITSQCLAQSASLIMARAEEIGLGEIAKRQEADFLQLDAVLPDIENAESDIPRLLIQEGHLSFQDGDKILEQNVEVKNANMGLGESGMPYARVVLETNVRQRLQKHILANPKGFVSIYLDGEKIVQRPNTNKLSDTELRLIYSQGGMKIQMKHTADWAIVLKHGPLPCRHSLQSLTQLNFKESK